MTKINPTGTTYKCIRVRPLNNTVGHSKAMKSMLRVMGEYIKDGCDVNLRTYFDMDGVERADLVCSPPMGRETQ